jgi:IS30 family transposase
MKKQSGKRGLDAGQTDAMWTLWKSGASISDVARELGKAPGSVFGYLAAAGGFEPRVRHRSARALTLEEREEISRGCGAGSSVRAIARLLGRDPSVISREINRNGGRERYRSHSAEANAWKRAERPKATKLEVDLPLQESVDAGLVAGWSPEQISGRLRRECGADRTRQVSAEAIYRAIYMNTLPKLENERFRHLRRGRRFRHSRRSSTDGQNRGRIIDAVPISQRPQAIDARTESGHWEGDLIAGSRNSHVVTLVERVSRYTVLLRVERKDTATVTAALIAGLGQLGAERLKSLTWDRGTELAAHPTVTANLGLSIYFCDPKSPWQRGTNENTNGLVRQYLPKGEYLSDYTQEMLNEIAARLNSRPRKVLDFRSPSEIFRPVLH